MEGAINGNTHSLSPIFSFLDSPTSFPGSSLFLPRGRKREDPGNEVAGVLC